MLSTSLAYYDVREVISSQYSYPLFWLYFAHYSSQVLIFFRMHLELYITSGYIYIYIYYSYIELLIATELAIYKQ